MGGGVCVEEGEGGSVCAEGEGGRRGVAYTSNRIITRSITMHCMTTVTKCTTDNFCYSAS